MKLKWIFSTIINKIINILYHILCNKQSTSMNTGLWKFILKTMPHCSSHSIIFYAFVLAFLPLLVIWIQGIISSLFGGNCFFLTCGLWMLKLQTNPHRTCESELKKNINSSSQGKTVFQLNEQLEVRPIQFCPVPEEHYHENKESESWSTSPHQNYHSLNNFPKV